MLFREIEHLISGIVESDEYDLLSVNVNRAILPLVENKSEILQYLISFFSKFKCKVDYNIYEETHLDTVYEKILSKEFRGTGLEHVLALQFIGLKYKIIEDKILSILKGITI